jgi:prepilin-type N-terminal cleavage/methylation domain-containing protein
MLADIRTMRREDGYTLIELVVVVVILGVVSTVGVSSLAGITERAKNVACSADKSNVTLAGEAYVIENGVPAASIDALVTAGFLNSKPLDVLYTVTTNSFSATGLAPCESD